MYLPKNVTKFLLDTIPVAEKNGCSVELVNDEYIYIDAGENPHVNKVSGYYDCELQKLVVAIKRPLEDWILNYAHEYSHFLQIQDEVYNEPSIEEAAINFDLWLEHKLELDEIDVGIYARSLFYCELDAEKRTVELIKKYNLSDPKTYIQKANAYLFTYMLMEEMRVTFDPPPARNKKIWKHLPITFGVDYRTAHEEYKSLYLTCSRIVKCG